MPFPYDIDPYDVLQVKTDATVEEIKKSYRKLCLKHHPDKLTTATTEEQEESRTQFEKIQFAHSVLSDEKKRQRFDRTGSLEETDGDFDWFDYFSQVKVEINQEAIARDKKVYQGSEDEEEDIIESWIENKGDFLSLFEAIPHLEPTKAEEKRIFDKVQALITDKVIESSGNWEAYKKHREKLFNKYRKSLKSEEKEAEELKKELSKKHKLDKVDTEDDLKQLIRKKNKSSLDSLIGRLEEKYAGKKSKGKAKGKAKGKQKKVPAGAPELDDAEFERLQKKLFKK